jgi:two-component system, OmpR family, KDP operon response regulator KdpE
MTAERARLLLVDDEPQILRSLTPALTAAGYAVDTADSAATALDRMAAQPADLIVLDLGLPDLDGKEVIRRVREWSDAPIIVLSARDLEMEKVAALDLGADDFVNKPVGIDELLARIRAGLRSRERRRAMAPVLKFGPLEINFVTRRIWLEGDEVKLTPREYDLLKALAGQPGGVLTHGQIIAAVWGVEANVEAQHVRVLMAQLRTKLEANPSSPRLLRTETGVGYRLESDDEGG